MTNFAAVFTAYYSLSLISILCEFYKKSIKLIRQLNFSPYDLIIIRQVSVILDLVGIGIGLILSFRFGIMRIVGEIT